MSTLIDPFAQFVQRVRMPRSRRSRPGTASWLIGL